MIIIEIDACPGLAKEKDAKAKPGKDVLSVVWLDVVEAALGTERVVTVSFDHKISFVHTWETVFFHTCCPTSRQLWRSLKTSGNNDVIGMQGNDHNAFQLMLSEDMLFHLLLLSFHAFSQNCKSEEGCFQVETARTCPSCSGIASHTMINHACALCGGSGTALRCTPTDAGIAAQPRNGLFFCDHSVASFLYGM